MSPKEQIIQALKQLPDDASYEDAMERIFFLHKVARGIAQADNGQTITQEQARQRLARWLD